MAVISPDNIVVPPAPPSAIDLSEVVNDPELAESFTILRSSGTFAEGGWQEATRQTIQTFGVVSPASSDDVNQLPEGDRISGNTTFYTSTPMYVTHTDPQPGTSDIIVWQGENYRLAMVWNYSTRGYYKAVGVRMSGT